MGCHHHNNEEVLLLADNEYITMSVSKELTLTAWCELRRVGVTLNHTLYNTLIPHWWDSGGTLTIMTYNNLLPPITKSSFVNQYKDKNSQ